MAKKPPKLEHVKYVRARGKLYAYFNSGQKKNGKPVYLRMPDPGTPGFFDSYTSLRGSRTKRSQPEYTVAHMAHEYERSAQFNANAANTQILYIKTLKVIVRHLGKFPVNALTRKIVQTVLDKEMAGPGAHNVFLGVLSALYKWGRDREKTDQEPAKGIARLRIEPHKAWREDVLDAALVADDDLVRLSVHLLYFTGQRIGDVCAMRWSDIREDVIHLVQQKTSKPIWVPLHSELRSELAASPKRGMTILADEDGKPLQPQFVRVRLQAFTSTKGQKTVAHGLRKNAVIALLEAGCSIAEVASITGQTYKIVEDYAREINQRRMAKAAVLKLENKRGLRKRDGKHASNSAE